MIISILGGRRLVKVDLGLDLRHFIQFFFHFLLIGFLEPLEIGELLSLVRAIRVRFPVPFPKSMGHPVMPHPMPQILAWEFLEIFENLGVVKTKLSRRRSRKL